MQGGTLGCASVLGDDRWLSQAVRGRLAIRRFRVLNVPVEALRRASRRLVVASC